MQKIKNLTEGPITRQLFQLAVPIMGTSFIQMAYSLTDMAWVGRLGSEAVAAIGAVGILTWLTQSISLMSKVGAEVTVAHSIGAQNTAEAKMYASHNLTIGLLVSLVWGALLFAFAHPLVGLYKLDAEISAMAVEYLRIVAAGFPFVFLASAFTGIHNAAGQSKIPFFVSGSGLVLNMILDPLFILGLGWGTAGAAYATWLSQLAVVLLFVYQVKVRKQLWHDFHFFVRLKRSYTFHIVRLGLPVALLNSFFAVINLLMGRTASTYGGHIGLMALTAGGQVEAIAWNTSQGFSTALSTFTAQNYAARRRERIDLGNGGIQHHRTRGECGNGWRRILANRWLFHDVHDAGNHDARTFLRDRPYSARSYQHFVQYVAHSVGNLSGCGWIGCRRCLVGD